MTAVKTYVLLGADGRTYQSPTKGLWGGHRRTKIYGRLDCPVALRAIARGGYVKHRVFFADEATAVAAGFRPCWTCLKDRYQLQRPQRLRDLDANGTDVLDPNANNKSEFCEPPEGLDPVTGTSAKIPRLLDSVDHAVLLADTEQTHGESFRDLRGESEPAITEQ